MMRQDNNDARKIGKEEYPIGIVGGGYMGKAHSVAMASVGAMFHTELRPKLEMICANSTESAERYRKAYGFARATDRWQELVSDPKVAAVVIASPQHTHRDIALAAFDVGKPVFCEKPLGLSVQQSAEMCVAADRANVVNMVGFNYIRTPASQYARKLIKDGAIGKLLWFRGEHSEDFMADGGAPVTWRNEGEANGTLGDLAPHMINAALALVGDIDRVMADRDTCYANRTNDDQAQLMCRFSNGVMGQMYFSRVHTGRKMGYCYEVVGSHGTVRFDQEDQNALWLYQHGEDEAKQGFRKILTGPAHPDYAPFCQGAGHGTGYQDQIIIEAKDFLEAIAAGKASWPSFSDGHAVNQVIAAARHSAQTGQWIQISEKD